MVYWRAQRIQGTKGSRGAGDRSVSSKNRFGAAESERDSAIHSRCPHKDAFLSF